jgi:hypothetical protein
MVTVGKEVVDRHSQDHLEVAQEAVDDSCSLPHVLEIDYTRATNQQKRYRVVMLCKEIVVLVDSRHDSEVARQAVDEVVVLVDSRHDPEVARQAVDDSCTLRHLHESDDHPPVHDYYQVQCVQCNGDWRNMALEDLELYIVVSLA